MRAWDERALDDSLHVLACVECPRVSAEPSPGWKGYRVDVDENDPPAVALYCPDCAAREFG